MIALSVGLVVLASVGALAFGAGFWLRALQSEEPTALPAPAPVAESGTRVQGVDDARELWARTPQGWTQLARRDQRDWFPVVEEEPQDPDSFGFPPVQDWVREVRAQTLVQGMLEAWTEACLGAAKVAWVTEIPTGDQLLEAWARQSPPTDDPPVAFAYWFVGEIGRAGRRGLSSRQVAEQRGPLIRGLHRSAARLIRALESSLELEFEPPPGIGIRDRETWLVDWLVAERLENGGAEVVDPVVVLRPVLRQRGQVLMEGEVA